MEDGSSSLCNIKDGCGFLCNSEECKFLDQKEVIASLISGDEIVVGAEFGYPKAEKDKTHIVAFSCGFSVVTADGIQLSCWDGSGIKKTGTQFSEFSIDKKAFELFKGCPMHNT